MPPNPYAQLQQLFTILAVTGALIYWIKSWRRSRTPGLLAMVKALAALALALVLGIDYGLPNWLFGIATLPNYLVHVLTLFAAYWLQLFVLYLAHPVTTLPARIRNRTRILGIAQAALFALYLLGPVSGTSTGITAESSDHAVVALYLLVFEVYLGIAMFDVVYVGRHARQLPRGYLRTGLRLLRWGGICGLAFVVHKGLYSLAVRFDLNPPWAEIGNVGASRVLTTAGILLLMAGVTVPAVAPRRLLRRHHRSIEPLWRDLTDFSPEVKFDQADAQRAGRIDITDRVRQRLNEINDVLVGPLQPHIDPVIYAAALQQAEAQPDAGIPAAATAEAVTIATALHAAQSGAQVGAERPVPFTAAATTDYRDEAAWLAMVAAAYVTSPNIATIRREISSHAADHAH